MRVNPAVADKPRKLRVVAEDRGKDIACNVQSDN